jgi:hypothetical protein
MKYLLLILLFCSCKQNAVIIEDDGCEYIAVKTVGITTSITHKGNCSNYIHSYVDTTDMLIPEEQFKRYYARQTNRHITKSR